MEVFLMTITGPYRPGVMNRLASLTHDYEGKWLNNNMANLEGRFAAIIKVSLPSAKSEALRTAITSLPDLQTTFHDCNDQSSSNRPPVQLNIDANDRPGLINDITHIISSHGISIQQMNSQRTSVAGTGHTVFTAEFTLVFPDGILQHELIDELEDLYPHLVAKAETIS